MIKNEFKTIQNEDLYEHHHIVVSKGQTSIRLDRFLANFLEQTSRNKIQQAAKNGSIYVNGIAEKSNYKVKSNDKISILFEYPPHVFLLKPEPLPLDIEYEDESIIVVNKKAGMVVHPGHGNYTGTLINGILHHVESQSETKMPVNSDNRPGLVHRIDKDTSGLLVIAKTMTAMTHLANQFFTKTIEREYIALVWGSPKNDEGVIKSYIGRHPKNRLQMTVFNDEAHGKKAITHYKVIRRFGYVTLVSCKLETGRTHQIRVHMKHIGHILFNDERYGGNNILKGTVFTKYKQFVHNCFKTLPRQALHAHTLGFVHPKTKKQINFTAGLPKDFSDCLDKWEAYSSQKA